MKRAKPPPTSPQHNAGIQKPYGYVLVLRAVARAAILHGENCSAAIRVLCVLADYVDQDGACRVGQDTIAARLNISRQAVNRQLRLLDDLGVVNVESPKAGVLLRYSIAIEDVEEEKFAQRLVEQRRKAKRAARRVQHMDVAGSKVGHLQHNEVALMQHPCVARKNLFRNLPKRSSEERRARAPP